MPRSVSNGAAFIGLALVSVYAWSIGPIYRNPICVGQHDGRPTFLLRTAL